MKRILDAHALMAFLEKEPGFKKIESLFKSAAEKADYLLITSVNLGEVFYIILRECGEDKARDKVDKSDQGNDFFLKNKLKVKTRNFKFKINFAWHLFCPFFAYEYER